MGHKKGEKKKHIKKKRERKKNFKILSLLKKGIQYFERRKHFLKIFV
jgi:hypothetical protein